MHDFYQPDDMDPDEFTNNLLKKIDLYQGLLTPGTEEYEIAHMMKGYAQIQLVNWNKVRFPENDEARLKDIKTLNKVLAMAKPVKLKKNGFMLYFDTLMTLSFHYRSLRKSEVARMHAKMCEEALQAYGVATSEVPTHSSDIEGESCFDQNEFQMMQYQVGYIIWQSYHLFEMTCPVQYPTGQSSGCFTYLLKSMRAQLSQAIFSIPFTTW